MRMRSESTISIMNISIALCVFPFCNSVNCHLIESFFSVERKATLVSHSRV